jgi:aminocarboxymuconate-semialdehyde decarboxylase
MRLDAYTHYIPAKFLERMNKVAGDHKDIGKRMRGIPAIYDLDVRRKVIDQFKNQDYAQIISYAMPPIEHFAKGNDILEYLKLINDGFAELCEQHKDYFPGWIAQVSLAIPAESIKEAERAMKMGALGIQIYTNVNDKPLDGPEFDQFWARMNELKIPIWVHPSRGANHPDYITEPKSLYEMWWTFGWPMETATFLARMIFSKNLDKYPDLKLILHHFGAIIPALEGRVGHGMDQLGNRTSDADYAALRTSLKKRILDYFKFGTYVDTATFGGKGAMLAGLEFYPHEKIIFASDCPFDPEKGTMYIRETIRILDEIDMPKEKREDIYVRNFEKLVGRKFTK